MTDQVQKSNRKRKVRALLAGGLVLGVGAAVTLAAWTDNVWGTSEFSTGDTAWNLQGNFTADGAPSGWDEYAEQTDAGDMLFPFPALQLTPGDTVFAPVGLRVEEANQYGAAVQLLGARTLTGTTPTTGLTPLLTYSVSTIASASSCAAGATVTGNIVPAGTALTAGTAPAAITLPDTGAAVQLCFAVTLPSTAGLDAAGLTTGDLYWQFAGTSID
ncbi:SipW-dependent-type signal peptide-containing protein [Rhodococcus sp. P1Y]|uniref:SipW-dependent-type signal peptide-containing protein n=1 Tax=Rhodococcus sp. P1Y TaxID=1302308 RepID=UPI000EB4EE1C|nr:SipW-dependent-type signal peptide-containing protein [Rhodococcus sp. P1Y]AYJ51237.1 hypothetical protein D8W71_26355 [Rhodococcus sp. P1Y]